MLLGEMTQSLLYEAMIPTQTPTQPQTNQAQNDPNAMMAPPPIGPGGEIAPQPDGTDETGDPAEFMPLKKYYLIQQLQDLQFKLKDNNLSFEDLDMLLKFCNNMTYQTLMRMSSIVINYAMIQLQNANKKKGSANGKQKRV